MKVNNKLKNNIVKLLYKLIDNLLYFNNNEKKLRLYIPFIMKTKIFKLAYDEMRYSNYARIYKRLIQKLYIYNIIIKLYKFIRYYLYC